MLQIRNLNITHTVDLHSILSDFSLTLNNGDKAAIIGEEGNGKSTLLKLIYDENLVSSYVEYSGEIIKNNLKIGYLAQELLENQLELTILEFYSLEPRFYELTPKELSNIGRKFDLNIEFFYSDQNIKSLSGGEKVKLQLAKILISGADLLLLDEPSNDIDISTLEWLESFINNCEKPILYISHDETLLKNTANMIIHLEQIKRKTVCKYTISKMGYGEYVDTRLKSLIHQEQVARKQRSDYEKQQERYRQIYEKVEHEQNVISRSNPAGGRLLKKKMHSVKAMGRRFEKEKENFLEIPHTEDAILIKFDNNEPIPNGKRILDLHIPKLIIDDRILAENISLNVMGPEHLCIIGNNGIGKTTLMKEIGKELLKRKDIKVAYMPQNYEELLDFNKTPVEFLLNTGDKKEKDKISTFLGCMKYTRDEMSHKIAQLSGGQKAKLILIKLTLEGYNVLLLDEPTRNFSPLSNPVIRQILSSFTGAIISISHDRQYIKEVCSTVYELTYNGLKKIEFNQ